MLQSILGNCWLGKLANSRGQSKNINGSLTLFCFKNRTSSGPHFWVHFWCPDIGPPIHFYTRRSQFWAPNVGPLSGTHCRMFLLLRNAPTGHRELNIVEPIARHPGQCLSGRLADHHGQKQKHKQAVCALLLQNKKQATSGPHLRGPSWCPEVTPLRSFLWGPIWGTEH